MPYAYDDPRGNHWLGHEWSGWRCLFKPGGAARGKPPSGTNAPYAHLPKQNGLYRVWVAGDDQLAYIGQGMLRDRMQVLRNAVNTGGTGSYPGADLSAAAAGRHQKFRISWVAYAGSTKTERRAMEDELIVAHMHFYRTPPISQYL